MSFGSSVNVQIDRDEFAYLTATNYCIIISSTLLWCDFVTAFSTEVHRIWSRKFTGAVVVYFLMRYVAILDCILLVLQVFRWNLGNLSCRAVAHVDDALGALNYFGFAAFTTLRIYGMSGRSWRVLVVVAPLALIRPVLTVAVITRYIPVEAGPLGCVIVPLVLSDHSGTRLLSPRAVLIAKGSSLIVDVVLLTLTWKKTLSLHRESSQLRMQTPLVRLLLVDGTIYFIVFTSAQLASLLFSTVFFIRVSHVTVLQAEIVAVFAYFDPIIMVICNSRFILDLRGIYYEDAAPGEWGDSTYSHIASRLVGHLGATTLPLSWNGETRDQSYPMSTFRSPNDRRLDDCDEGRVAGGVPSEERHTAEGLLGESRRPEFVGYRFRAELEGG